ncbi:hypothetical protein DNTS_021080 [Danionella cerebrum]|uniref:Proline-rich transmembrane protein 3/4 domain-containing protein n=1 Tax=Danionella cerebrum TaxID=2873325 RepID=A0A553Q285_9TELE|nr:hypothetical protein DNTS_021080 [Danionella translucida]
MLLMCETAVVICLLSSAGGFFSGSGPKPSAQTKADSRGWALPYMPKWRPWFLTSGAEGFPSTKVYPTIHEASTQDYTLSSEDLTSLKSLPTTTTNDKLQTTALIGTLLPLRSAKLPKDNLPRNKPRLDNQEPPSELDQNYDLDLWPPNNGKSTTSQSSTPNTLSTHLDPRPEVSTTPPTSISQRETFGTTNTTSKTDWITIESRVKTLDGSKLAEETTAPTEGERVHSFDINTRPEGADLGLEGDKDNSKSTDLTTEKHQAELSTSASATTVRSTDMPITTSEDWLTDYTEESPLPDCNAERSGICSFEDTWPTPVISNSSRNISATTVSTNLSLVLTIPAAPMFVALRSNWNGALAAWGSMWEAHIYGLGTVFCLVALASTLNLLCLPLQYPSGCGYFALVSLNLVAVGCTKAFALVYDAYGYQDRMASMEASFLLYEAPFPCMTAAFGLVFLLLSMRSRMQLSYSAFQRPYFLACLVLLHFATAFGPVALLHVDRQVYLFLSLISRGAFVAMATFLSGAYFVFYCYVRADSKHIYHLNNTSPTPAERYNRCPFAESRDWERAAAAVLLSAIFSLVCAGLQLYAMLHALGMAGSAEGFHPWPWWTFQFSCRVCEAVVCLTLILVVSQPIYCSDHLPQSGSCWTELLAAKSPIIPGSYQWTLSHQEKLAICEQIGHGETECLPLYTLVDDRLSSLNGLDLLYHSNRALAYRDLDLPNNQLDTAAPSVGSSFTSDSTADLHPPSPINLRRSIDEALFSESLFPISLFSQLRPFTSSDNSLTGRENNPSCTQTVRDTLTSDTAIYRASSCAEALPQVPLIQSNCPSLGFPPSPSPSLSSSTSSSSPEHWRGSSSSSSLYRQSLGDSSLVLCSSPGHHPTPMNLSNTANSGHRRGHVQRPYRTLKSEESLDQQPEFDQSIQEEFVNVCKQIDAVSICSETIDL